MPTRQLASSPLRSSAVAAVASMLIIRRQPSSVGPLRDRRELGVVVQPEGTTALGRALRRRYYLVVLF